MTTKIEIELTETAMQDLTKLKIRLARLWDQDVTDSMAIKWALAGAEGDDWRIKDLMPPEPEGSA